MFEEIPTTPPVEHGRSDVINVKVDSAPLTDGGREHWDQMKSTNFKAEVKAKGIDIRTQQEVPGTYFISAALPPNYQSSHGVNWELLIRFEQDNKGPDPEGYDEDFEEMSGVYAQNGEMVELLQLEQDPKGEAAEQMVALVKAHIESGEPVEDVIELIEGYSKQSSLVRYGLGKEKPTL